MPYTSTRTWLPGETFPVGDHNTYIRDNLKAIRILQRLGQPIFGGPVVLSGSPLTIVSLLNIEPFIDEPWTLQVVAYCSAVGTTTPGGINVTMFDNAGAAMTVTPATLWMPTGGFYPGSGICVGTSGSYAGGAAKPGFTVKFQLTYGTAGNGWATAFAYARPTSTTVKP